MDRHPPEGDPPVARRVGFYFGGWTLASTTQNQVEAASQASVVRVLAPICADKFQRSADAGTNLKALNAADSWKRDEIIEKAGWTTFPARSPSARSQTLPDAAQPSEKVALTAGRGVAFA